ncbi:MAG TPA: hypothetical protein VFI27_06910, partial [candidate division Zixibacteria bacterium]|nr:hypothetical protein [candidate division Zixibacteria bacterium]
TRILIVGVPVPRAIENVDGDGEFTVSWSSVPGTVGYELQEQFDFGEWNLVHQGSDNNADRTVYMVGNWCYRVRALDYFSYGNWSNTVCTFADSVNHLIFMPAILKQ